MGKPMIIKFVGVMWMSGSQRMNLFDSLPVVSSEMEQEMKAE
jgi:hypothetical protein